jgi:Zn-dependent protease/predicted transcriptional regulator
VAGIGIYMHVTFPLLLIWVGASQYLDRHDWNDVQIGVGFVLLLFAIVVLHELGHSLTARRFGIQTRDITLLPIGGVARLERLPQEPMQELYIALAGPAVNVCLAVLFFSLIAMGGQIADALRAPFIGARVLVTLMWANVVLACFNMVPAFPMDGGRVLRAILATRLSYVRATRIAARIGQTLAIAFAIVGVFQYKLWILLAAFVYFGASREAAMVQMKSALNGLRVADLMLTDFRALQAEDTLAHAREQFVAGWQRQFPVLHEERMAGVLTGSALAQGLKKLGPSGRVADIMETTFAEASPEEPAEAALGTLQNSRLSIMPVTDSGQLVGVVSAEKVRDFLMVRGTQRSLPAGQVPPVIETATQASQSEAGQTLS